MSEWTIISYPGTIWHKQHGPYTEAEARDIFGKLTAWGKYQLLRDGEIVDRRHIKAPGAVRGLSQREA